MKVTLDASAMDHTVDFLCRRIAALLERNSLCPQHRILITLAGVPGSGKSTISTTLMDALRLRAVDHVALLPMVSDTLRVTVS
jgi:adenylylsulfate kinase-like enzyme